MKDFITYLARSLARKPEEVFVTEKIEVPGKMLYLTVASEDINFLIGKQGRTVKAMRTLLAVAGTKKGLRYGLDIVTENEAPPSEADAPPLATEATPQEQTP